MNPLPPNADELVSAYLDGQAAPDEIAAVEASPELMARVESMRVITAQIATPATPPAVQKEAHIAAALGAFDELFGASPIPAVPDPVATEASAAAAAASPTAPSQGPATQARNQNVASLDAARERRKRRVNIGLIAAAMAAFALLAVFSLGGSRGDEVATSSADAVDTSTNAAGSVAVESSRSSDDADEAMADDATEEEAMEEAMAEPELEAATGSAEAAPAPEPTPPPPSAAADTLAEEGDAMADEDMADSQAMDEAASEELAIQISPFFFGSFETLDDVQQQFASLTPAELDARKAGIGQGIFARCQSEIAELAEIDSPTLLGEVGVGGLPREVHILVNDDGANEIIVVDPAGCTIEARFN